MKKIIRITESKLAEIVSKILNEQSITGYVSPQVYGNKTPAPKPKVQLPREKWEKDPNWNGQDQENITPPDIVNSQEKKKVVMAIQQKLGIKVDGIYGHQTARAVANFQKSTGEKPTGIISNGDHTQINLRVGFGSVKMLTPLGTTPMSDPIKKPIAPPRDTTAMSTIPSRPAGKVGLQQPKKDTISQDYRQRQGNV